MAVVRLQHVSVPMPSDGHGKARHFYGETLGLTEITPPAVLGKDRVIWFTFGERTAEVHVYIDDRGPGTSTQHLCLQVEDLDAMRANLKANGYAADDTDVIPNRPRFFTFDPFGNRVEISAILGPYS